MAKDHGEIILNSMVGKSVSDISFKKKAQAVTLNSKSGVEINQEVVNIDPQLLFQRLVTVREKYEDTEHCSSMSYAVILHLCSTLPFYQEKQIRLSLLMYYGMWLARIRPCHQKVNMFM